MDGRQCILTALDGGVPDPIPVAWGFRLADLTALAPYGTDVDGLVDIEFVAYPPTPADEDLREPRALAQLGGLYAGGSRAGMIQMSFALARAMGYTESQGGAM